MGLNPPQVQTEKDQSGSYFLICEDGKKAIRVDVDFKERHKIGIKSDLLARAIGYKAANKAQEKVAPLSVLDATAGLCRDSFHMAALGCEVLAIEESPTLYKVVAEHIGQLDAEYKLTLIYSEAKKFLREWLSQDDKKNIDVIYLDPMFPEKKKSAKSGKETILLKLLAPISSQEAETELLDLALKVATHRVVVKRPPGADPLKSTNKNFAKPSAQYEGKAVRYDVYIRVSVKPS